VYAARDKFFAGIRLAGDEDAQVEACGDLDIPPDLPHQFRTELGILKKERENTASPKFPYFTALSATAFAPRGRFRKQLRSTNDI
jgi:hypothetical protein